MSLLCLPLWLVKSWHVLCCVCLSDWPTADNVLCCVCLSDWPKASMFSAVFASLIGQQLACSLQWLPLWLANSWQCSLLCLPLWLVKKLACSLQCLPLWLVNNKHVLYVHAIHHYCNWHVACWFVYVSFQIPRQALCQNSIHIARTKL